MTPRRLFYRVVLVALALAAACTTSAPPREFAQKLVILGFDGMDPRLVDQWMAEGKLPNMAKLANQGGKYHLETTASPESPTSWSSFAIGANPGKHSIYDFLVHDVKTYMPDIGMVRREMPSFLFNYIPTSRPKVISLRGGTSFWIYAGEAGVRSSILTVPVTFPPETVPNGQMLSGLPLPDVRGTIGTFYYFATDLGRYEEGSTEMGGILNRLVFSEDTASTELIGPPNPIVKAQTDALRKKGAALTDAEKARLADLDKQADVTIPLVIHWKRLADRATIDLQGSSVTLSEGEWSGWIPLEFRVNFLVRVYGMVQLLLVKAGEDLQLYVSPVNWRPDSPMVPISAPPSYATTLYKQFGTYRTLGWAEATWPLNEDRIDEKAFMDDLFRAFDDRAKIVLREVDSGKSDLIVFVSESTDRVQHMFWYLIDPTHPMYSAAQAAKYGDSIERVYRRCDDLVGQVLQKVGPDTLVMVLSDHGFHSFRQAVNLNTFLVQEGFLAREGEQASDRKRDEVFLGGQFWQGVDWSRSRAYSLGLGQIYFNLRGREAQGIVSPGEEYKRLADDISAKLLALTDPATGARVVSAVYRKEDVFWGPYIDSAPDLQVGFADGYRVSWQTSLGGSPPGIVYPNMRKWSGDHCSFDYRTIPGVLVSGRKLDTEDPRIIDMAPTVLRYFGLPIPKDMDGKPLF
jgi:predicted AlkP superfamily phosphohydrolase/phosphomutase